MLHSLQGLATRGGFGAEAEKSTGVREKLQAIVNTSVKVFMIVMETPFCSKLTRKVLPFLISSSEFYVFAHKYHTQPTVYVIMIAITISLTILKLYISIY